MPISKYLKGFSSVQSSSLPTFGGIFLVSCEKNGIHSPIYAGYSENISSGINAASKNFNFMDGCNGTLHFQVLKTTDIQKADRLVQELSRDCKYK